jgi:hypothetical protein
MARHDDKNPSDFSGTMATGQLIPAIVVDMKDPQKRGRMKIRLMTQDVNHVPDDKLPWVQGINNNQPSNKGQGFFPPNYQNGSKIYVMSQGQQGYIVMGSVPNSETDPATADTHEDTRDTEHRGVYTNEQEFDRYCTANTSQLALISLNQGDAKWQKDQKDHNENINQAPTTDKYGKRSAVKDPKGSFPTIGIEKFANFRNPQAFIKGIIGNRGSVMPQALDMLENLKKVNPLGTPMPTPSIGMQNILQALQGLQALLQKQGQNDTQEIQDIIDVVAEPAVVAWASLRADEDDDTSTGVADYSGS